jgi:hypothetical protein
MGRARGGRRRRQGSGLPPTRVAERGSRELGTPDWMSKPWLHWTPGSRETVLLPDPLGSGRRARGLRAGLVRCKNVSAKQAAFRQGGLRQQGSDPAPAPARTGCTDGNDGGTGVHSSCGPGTEVACFVGPGATFNPRLGSGTVRRWRWFLLGRRQHFRAAHGMSFARFCNFGIAVLLHGSKMVPWYPL